MAKHEGIAQQPNSHSDMFFKKLDTYALGPIIEQLVAEYAITRLELGPRVAIQRAAAIDSSRWADSSGYAITLTCQVIF